MSDPLFNYSDGEKLRSRFGDDIELLSGKLEKKDEAKIKKMLANKRALVVRQCSFGRGARAMLNRAIKESPIELLSAFVGTAAHSTSICKAVADSKSITSVELGYHSGPKVCYKVIKTWTRVKSFTLYQSHVTGQQLAQIFENRSITKLNISNINKNIKPVLYLDALWRRPKFTTLIVRGVPIPPEYIKSGVVEFSYSNYLSRGAIVTLFDAIRDSTLKKVKIDLYEDAEFLRPLCKKTMARNWVITKLRVETTTLFGCILIERNERALRDVIQWLLVNGRLKLVSKDVQGIIASFVGRSEGAPCKKRRLK